MKIQTMLENQNVHVYNVFSKLKENYKVIFNGNEYLIHGECLLTMKIKDNKMDLFFMNENNTEFGHELCYLFKGLDLKVICDYFGEDFEDCLLCFDRNAIKDKDVNQILDNFLTVLAIKDKELYEDLYANYIDNHHTPLQNQG